MMGSKNEGTVRRESTASWLAQMFCKTRSQFSSANRSSSDNGIGPDVVGRTGSRGLRARSGVLAAARMLIKAVGRLPSAGRDGRSSGPAATMFRGASPTRGGAEIDATKLGRVAAGAVAVEKLRGSAISVGVVLPTARANELAAAWLPEMRVRAFVYS